MRRLLLALLTPLCFCAATRADAIKLYDGRTLYGDVTEYRNGVLRIRQVDGQETVAAIAQVQSVRFDGAEPVDENTLIIPPPAEYEEPLRDRIAKAKEQIAKSKRPSAIVALYLDTKSVDEAIPQGYVEYRCYQGGGYSGIVRVPLRQPWTRLETVYNENEPTRRIQIDPGPPYAVINRDITLVTGEATNLGRIVLRKVEATGTVTLSGFVQTASGDPVEGALVTAGSKRVRTDAEGFYRLDGFGLEVVRVSIRKKGFISLGSTVSIRDTEKQKIANDFTLYRPRRVKLRYVISGKDSSTFEGPDVEQGVLERTVESSRVNLAGTLFASKSFTAFAADARLHLSLRTGELTLDNSYAPIYFQSVEPDVDFASIDAAGPASINSQRCPPLREGTSIIVRGFREEDQPRANGRRGVTPYCVKFHVEELAYSKVE